jgi:hypothetical protein
MATLKDLNKTITTTSQKLTSTTNKDALLKNSSRTRDDLNGIATFTNRVVIEGFKSLTSGETYPEDVLDKGISGNTTITHLINCGNNQNAHEAFWLETATESRPKTIKETFDHVLGVLNTSNITNIINQEDDRINDAFELIKCNFNYIRKITTEVLGSKYIDYLSCNDFSKTYTYTVSTHIYNILSQLTVGLDPSIVLPYNQEENDVYPTLSIPFDRISGRIEKLGELLDVTITSLTDGQILQWSEAIEEWVNVDAPNINNTAGAEGQVLRNRSGVWTPENLPADIDTTIEYINELEDVDTLTVAPSNGDVLIWNDAHIDSTASNVGSWIPQNFVGGSLGQKLGGILSGTSTLDDVHDMEDILAAWRTAWSIPTGYGNNPAAVYDLLKRGVNRYRPGAILQFGGDDNWYSSLGGNTSNFNAVSLVPEIWSKNSVHLTNLSAVEKEGRIEGGLKPVPFVFINSFRLSLKEKLDPGFSTIIYGENIEVPSGISSGNTALDAIYHNFDQSVLEDIFNTNPNFSNDTLKNEILAPAKTHPLGMTACSAVYSPDGTNYELEYKPNYLLGVSRTDVSYLPELVSINSDIFISDENDELTGEISNDHIEAIQFRVVNGIGNEVQHSGYSRVMILGPYNIGDNIYICPEPLLQLMGIHYPYGICISDTFLTKSLAEILDPASRLEAMAPNTFAAFNIGTESFFSWLVGVFSNSENLTASLSLLGFVPSAMLDEALVADILTSPVGFIVKDDSPRLDNTATGNLANSICRNLLGSTISPSGTSAVGTLVHDFYMDIYSEAAFGSTSEDFTINEFRNLAWLDDLHLPTCKIQLPSLRYDRDLHAGTEGPQGGVGPIGPQGSQGTQGLPGIDGSEGPQGPQGVAGSDAQTILLPTSIYSSRRVFDENNKTYALTNGLVESIYNLNLDKSNPLFLNYPDNTVFSLTILVRVGAFTELGGQIEVDYVDPNGISIPQGSLTGNSAYTAPQQFNAILSGSYYFTLESGLNNTQFQITYANINNADDHSLVGDFLEILVYLSPIG